MSFQYLLDTNALSEPARPIPNANVLHKLDVCQKPEPERNLPKLKKCLLALLVAVTFTATPIAGMTDFVNNVMDIGNKLGIGLVLK